MREGLLQTHHTTGLGVVCGRRAGRTDTLSVVGQPLSSMGPKSGSSREYSMENVTGFT